MNIQRHENNNNEIHISAVASAIEQMKCEFARELGITLGPETSAKSSYVSFSDFKLAFLPRINSINLIKSCVLRVIRVKFVT
ncbi:hypothetical protein BC2926_25950 [Bacillus cereus]|uniref:small, acid-soluble spore protein, alpha/beta type n=1 Tax=Bacillus nitratireducens TaxID=2026193 RepID=UPI0003312428|nr:small, acid-soluble spore protein, alpha/beta type [Bacillus nitratireducens]EOP53963.1 hypothetical protein IKQ_02803 [Bacillus cereus VDM053]GCF75054.1 hypothetical protein BC2926_25950 [Bacillus cereus]SEB17345.1 Small, acid-soluble spore protein, alpha/beta type [Bacillus nitratireducens]